MTRLVAFVLGNSHYDNAAAFPPLKHPEKDATDVFRLLTEDPTGIFSAEHSMCRTNLTLEELQTELNAFFLPLDKSDTVLMYFSCHGRSFSQKHLVLVTTNTNDGNLAGTAFNVSLLGAYLSERRISRYVLIFDCCQAGTIMAIPGLRARGLTSKVNLDGLSGMGKWLIASCHDYQLANELDELEHGLFTHYLLDGVQTGCAVNSELEFVDVQSICVFASGEIGRKYPNIAQEPIYTGEDLKGDPIYIARNPSYTAKFNAAKSVLEAAMRHLNLRDLSDEAQFNIARIEKFRYFAEINPIVADDNWKERLILYGEAIGLDSVIISEEVSEIESLQRFQVGPPTIPLHEIEPVQPAKGFAAIFSSQANQSGYSISDKGSIFGQCLNEGLAGAAANARGLVTIQSAFEFLTRRMEEVSRRLSLPRQTPMCSAENEVMSFALTARREANLTHLGQRKALLVASDYRGTPTLALQSGELQVTQANDILRNLGGFETISLVGEAMTRINVVGELDRLCQQALPDESLLVYFCGHSVLHESSVRLVLNDSNIESSSGLSFSTLDVRYLADRLRRSRAGTAIAILDTSFAGSALSEFQ